MAELRFCEHRKQQPELPISFLFPLRKYLLNVYAGTVLDAHDILRSIENKGVRTILTLESDRSTSWLSYFVILCDLEQVLPYTSVFLSVK